MQENIKDLCRLCGQTAVERGRTPHSKGVHKDVILRALEIDVSSDVTSVHPPYVCHTCVRNLDYWWKKQYRKGIKCTIKVHNYRETSCSSCSREYTSFHDISIQHVLTVWQGQNFKQAMKFTEMGEILLSIRCYPDLSWKTIICDREVLAQHIYFEGIPAVLDQSTNIIQLVHTVVNLNVCLGNDDFDSVVAAKTGLRGEIPITITRNDSYTTHPLKTICHNSCTLLVPKPSHRCQACKIHRGDLFSIVSRRQKAMCSNTSTRNDRLSHAELMKKASVLSNDKGNLSRKISHMASKVKTLIDQDGLSLQPNQQDQVMAAMLSCESSMKNSLRPGSPAYLLWEQQKESAKKGRGMRWHPAILRFCIAVHSKSPSAYNLLRESGFLHLPHTNTLHPYSHFGNPTIGFNTDLVSRILRDVNLENLPEHQQNVTIAFDEMKIKSGLVYNRRTGHLVGFLDVGSVGNEIKAFERKVGGDNEAPLATHVLVLMIRGLFSALHSPIGFYATAGASSHQLYHIIHEAIVFLETVGFKVRGLVCDGASPNRKFYKLYGAQQVEGVQHFAVNPVDPSRKIFFFCDVPHLLKTTRNNFENSGWNNKTRTLHFRKQDIKWSRLISLYNWDMGFDRTSPGLRRLHKITNEHLYLTPSLRMRVYMAAQVLSSTVANTFKARGGHDTKSTEFFLTQFDQFFDCLNVSSPHGSTRKRKPALAPYTSADDWRFKWLTDEFLGFLDEWQNEVDSLHDVDKAIRLKMCLSRETLEGLRITVHSFVELGQMLLKEEGVEYLLSEKLNQDPLEQYFSKQCGAGGSSDNPTVEQFGHNMFAVPPEQGP